MLRAALTDPHETVQITTVQLQCQFFKVILLFRAFRTVQLAFPHLHPLINLAAKGDFFNQKDGWKDEWVQRYPNLAPVPRVLSPILAASRELNPHQIELESDKVMSRSCID